MTKRIGIWSMSRTECGSETAVALNELDSTETEQRLEDLLVNSPDVLAPGLRLIGRQVVTSGGPLDLLGVDADGNVVLFELKRGTLTREAVAQILDYASDLMARSEDDFAGLIESSSGRSGIEQIEDFAEWYAAEFPNAGNPDLESMKLVLVGLGVDSRARRIVNLLASTGLNIQMLTFQAFQQEAQVFLARQVETVEPRHGSSRSGGGTKAQNMAVLEELAQEHGVRELLIEVADFIDRLMPAYRWPGKTAFTFSMSDVTDEGRPTQRTYATLWIDQRQRGQVIFSLPERAIDCASGAVQTVLDEVAAASLTTNSWTPFAMPIARDTWPTIQPHLKVLIAAVVEGWEAAKQDQ